MDSPAAPSPLRRCTYGAHPGTVKGGLRAGEPEGPCPEMLGLAGDSSVGQELALGPGSLLSPGRGEDNGAHSGARGPPPSLPSAGRQLRPDAALSWPLLVCGAHFRGRLGDGGPTGRGRGGAGPGRRLVPCVVRSSSAVTWHTWNPARVEPLRRPPHKRATPGRMEERCWERALSGRRRQVPVLTPPCPHHPPFSLRVSPSPVVGGRVGTFSPPRPEYTSNPSLDYL